MKRLRLAALVLAAVGVGLLVGGKGSAQQPPGNPRAQAACNYSLKRDLGVVLPHPRIKYHIIIVTPDPRVDYKILKVLPDPNIDYKIIRVMPICGKQAPRLHPQGRPFRSNRSGARWITEPGCRSGAWRARSGNRVQD